MAIVGTLFSAMSLFLLVASTMTQQDQLRLQREEMQKNEERRNSDEEEKAIRTVFDNLRKELHLVSYKGKTGRLVFGELFDELAQFPWWWDDESIEPHLEWMGDKINEFNKETEQVHYFFCTIRTAILTLRDCKLNVNTKLRYLQELTGELTGKWLICYLYFEKAENYNGLAEDMHDVLYGLWLSRAFIAEYVQIVSLNHVKEFMEENLAIKNLATY